MWVLFSHSHHSAKDWGNFFICSWQFKHFSPLKFEPTWLCFKSLPPISYTIPSLGWLAHPETMSTIQIHNMWGCAQAWGQGLEDPVPGLEWGEIRHGKNNKQLLKCSQCYLWSKQKLISSKLAKF